MNFGLAINISIEIIHIGNYIQSLSDELKQFFNDKQYGNDIKNYTIGIICQSPQFEAFYREIKPKYTKGIKVINPDGIPFTLEDSLEYNVKVDYKRIKDTSEKAAKEILAKEILASFGVLEKVKSKIKDFDFDSFETDLEEYFKAHKLI